MASLKQVIRQRNKPLPRIAIVGIGHELRGDDAAGIIVAHRLQALSVSNFLIINAGPAPENFIGKLRRFAPDVLILVDAVQMDALPGMIRLLTIDELESYSLTTHTLSPHLLITHLQMELHCIIRLLGIQPGQDSFGSELSSAVRQSIDQIVQVVQTEVV
jgi:hydrogenase maturation protease HycI